jgi:hypothetical protein
MTITDPGNPNTGSFALARINDGSVLDPDIGMLGAAVYYERVDVVDPDPGMAERIAVERLRTLGGAVVTLTVRCVPQPWLQPGQVIGIEYNGTRSVAQVAGWSMDVGERSEMTVQLRAWRVTSEVGLPVYPLYGPHDLELNRADPIGLDRSVDLFPQTQPQPPESPVEES